MAGRTAGRSLFCRMAVSEALSSTRRTVVEPEHLHIANTSHSSILHLPRRVRDDRTTARLVVESLLYSGGKVSAPSPRPFLENPCFASLPVSLLSLALHYPLSPLLVSIPSLLSSSTVFRRRERREARSD